MFCGWDTSYIVSVHIQCQASIYTLSLCRGHTWRVRLAKQETMTPPGHLISLLACRDPWISTVVLFCWCRSDSASVLLYFTFENYPDPIQKCLKENLSDVSLTKSNTKGIMYLWFIFHIIKYEYHFHIFEIVRTFPTRPAFWAGWWHWPGSLHRVMFPRCLWLYTCIDLCHNPRRSPASVLVLPVQYSTDCITFS